jgi:pimeloyl-ACP methyl ester carboxylesterase
MTSWHEGDIEVHGLRIHYTRTGGAKPPLVLAHGVTDDGLCWTPVAAVLQADYDVVMVDARGHGRSAAPAQGYGPAAQADDLRGVIAALELQRPAILGHSMGAATTLVLAGTYPDVPGAILLEDPPTWWLPPSDASPSTKERQAGMRAWLGDLKHKTRAELIAQQRAATPGWSEAELEPWADAKLRVSPNVLDIFDGRTATSIDWTALLPRITCPALLITGDPVRGAIVTEHAAHALQTLVPQLHVAHIADAGHSIRRDQLDQYQEVVRAFLHDPSKNN